MKTLWIVQSNMNEDAFGALADAVSSSMRELLPVRVIPFDTELPTKLRAMTSNYPRSVRLTASFSAVPALTPADLGPMVVYGSTNFVEKVRNSPRFRSAVFHDPERFRWSETNKHWPMLNVDFVKTTIGDFPKEKWGEYVFVRPDLDLKQFSGEVVASSDFARRMSEVSAGGFLFDESCEIIVSTPKRFYSEWRLFVVDGKVASGSRYRWCSRRSISGQVPDAVISFAESMARIYSPAPVFALDICSVGFTEDFSTLRVVEANCFNSSGFYAADVKEIVARVSEHVEGNFRCP